MLVSAEVAVLKLRTAIDVGRLVEIPNVGAATVADFAAIGIASPGALIGRDPYAMYAALCEATAKRHDPCVIDVFISAVRFMEGAPPHPWWHYTAERKEHVAAISDKSAGC